MRQNSSVFFLAFLLLWMVLCCVVVLAVFSVPFLCLRIPRDSGHVILIVACFHYTILPFCCMFLNNFINVFFGVFLAMFYSVFVAADVVCYLPFMFDPSLCL